MCKITDHELYLGCGHKIPCHLKHNFRYCAAPNGIPFTNPDAYKSNLCPNRFCKEEYWISRTKKIEGECRDCREEKRAEKRERMVREAARLDRLEREDREMLDVTMRDADEEEEPEDDDGDGDSDTRVFLSSDSESEAFPLKDLDENGNPPAGVMKSYTMCDCSIIFYEGGKLQSCFEKKPPITQMKEKAQRAADYAAQRFRSSGTPPPPFHRIRASTGTSFFKRIEPHTAIFRTLEPQTAGSEPRAPTPPTVDKKLIKAHKAAETEVFSTEMRDALFCAKRVQKSRCANCERQRIMGEVEFMEQYLGKAEGFRARKPKGLWIFPATDKAHDEVVAVRDEV